MECVAPPLDEKLVGDVRVIVKDCVLRHRQWRQEETISRSLRCWHTMHSHVVRTLALTSSDLNTSNHCLRWVWVLSVQYS